MSVGETVAAPATGQEEIPASAGAPSHAAARRTRRGASVAGAVVLGGDYQGLGIVRSLGRHGVPTFVIDDERSISRFSRHCGGRAWIADLGTGDGFVDELLRLGRVVRPRRLGALPDARRDGGRVRARARSPADGSSASPTPGWEHDSVGLGQAQHLPPRRRARRPAPRTWHAADRRELEAHGRRLPARDQAGDQGALLLRDQGEGLAGRRSRRAAASSSTGRARIVGAGEVMVQELIPGDGGQQFAYCALFKDGRAVALDGRAPAAPAPAGVRPREHLRRRRSSCRRRRAVRAAASARSTTTASSSSSTSSIRATGSSSCSTSTPAPGATTRSARRRVSTSPTCSSGISSAAASRRSAPAPACAGSGCSRTCRPAARRDPRRAPEPHARTCARCAVSARRPSSTARTRCPGSSSSPCSRTWP